MLCRLFVHWSQDVREYLHRLLVFRIIIPSFILVELSHRNSYGLTELQRLLICGYEEVVTKKPPADYQGDSTIFGEERQDGSYESIGRDVLLYLTTHHSNEVLEAQRQAVTSHLYVGVMRMDHE